MTTAFDQVKVDADSLSQECEKQGCEVGLAGILRPFYLIDVDRDPLAKGTRCDYLLVGEDAGPQHDLYVAPIELKSSGFKAQSVSKQVAGGTKIADRRVPKVQCRFVPVVAHGGTHRGEIDKLAKHPVCFRGKPKVIKTLKCGDDISPRLWPNAHSGKR